MIAADSTAEVKQNLFEQKSAIKHSTRNRCDYGVSMQDTNAFISVMWRNSIDTAKYLAVEVTLWTHKSSQAIFLPGHFPPMAWERGQLHVGGLCADKPGW